MPRPPQRRSAGTSAPAPRPVAKTPVQIIDERAAATPARVFKSLGEELHGAEWVAPTARDLGLDVRTVQRIAAEKKTLTEGPMLDDLRFLVESHRAAVARIRARRAQPAKK